MKPCPFCGLPFIFTEIKDPGIELRHESKECPIDGFLGWFETREQAANSNWFKRANDTKSAASILGSIKTEKKARSSAENGKKGGRPRKL